MTRKPRLVPDTPADRLADTPGDRLLDVVVIGGSQAGLAMAWHLARLGLRFVVLACDLTLWACQVDR
jgi:ribulose 1,5-bisphosphate synthetase/thiazole synthase